MSEAFWKTIHLGEVALIQMGQAPPGETVRSEGKGLPFLQGNAEFGERSPNSILQCSRPIRRARAGDVLISVRAPVGALNLADRDYAIGRGLAAVRFAHIYPLYGWYALQLAASQLDKVAQGSTFTAVGGTELRRLKLQIPVDLGEQRRIAEVLDALDEEIGHVRRLVSKVRATRRALLRAELVTVAKYAKLYPLKELGLKGGEYGSNSPSISYSEKLPRYVRITDIDDNGRLRSDSKVSHPAVGSSHYMLQEGDLLIARTGFTTGKTLLFEAGYGDCVFAGYLVRYRLDRSKVDPQYVYLWTLGDDFSRWVNQTFREVGQRNISASEYDRHMVPVPPVEVQHRLIDQIARLNRLIDSHQSRCSRLLELKSGLAEDLLTGRVRV